jgi:outer membrane receptor protein involved in Fe transport
MPKLLASLIGILLVGSALAADPVARRLTMDIPSQPLGRALEQFAAQTGVQVLYVSDLAVRVTSHHAPAGLAAPEALTRILLGTGLRYEFLNARTVRLLAVEKQEPAAARPSGAARIVPRDPAPSPAQLLQEIVVTATKREQSLQDVPVAVSLISADTLHQAQMRDLLDMQGIVPSLRITQLQTSTQTNFVMRSFGNGANNPGLESSVGMFVDGVYRSRSASQIIDLVDVQRVEVLRGPQSTLFGQSASAGVISVVTPKPSFTAGGSAELSVGDYHSLVARARYTGPISDRLAFSLTVASNTRDGYFTNLLNGHKINDRDRSDIRGQLLFNATDRLSVRVIADSSRVNELCCGVVNLLNGPTGAAIASVGGKILVGDPHDRRGYLNVDPSNEVRIGGASLHVDWQQGPLALASITALRRQRATFNYDTDFSSADLFPTNVNHQSLRTFTQELRVHFDGGGRISGLLGGYLFDEHLEVNNNIAYGAQMRDYVEQLVAAETGDATILGKLENSLGLPSGSFFLAGTGGTVDARQSSRSYTLFGQADWKLSEQLTLTTGIAYTRNRKNVSLTYAGNDVFSSLDLVQLGFASAFSMLTGGLAPTTANFVTFPSQAALADAISVRPCSATSPPPQCNAALSLYPLQILAPVVPFDGGRSTDGKATYTLRLAYDISDHARIYAGVATGFKATSWNLSRDSKPFEPPVPDRSPLGGFQNPYYGRYGTRYAGPENSTAYELGFKGQWPHGLLYIALFDQAIRGFQSNVFVGTGFKLANAGKQSARGAEFDAVLVPNRHWEIALSGTLIDPRFDSFVGAEGPTGPVDLSGTRPAGTHTRSLSTSATYRWPIGRFQAFARAEHQCANEVQVVENVAPEVASRKINTINATFGLTYGRWEALLWGHNLTQDNYLLSAFPSVLQPGSVSGYPNTPRMWGLTLRKTF